MEKGKGVIFFSLGTIANTTNLPPRVMMNVFEVTQKFKDYNFIVKVDKYDKVIIITTKLSKQNGSEQL